MNDGEYITSFNQLKDARKYIKNARKYIEEYWHDYISRYHVIYDNKKNQYI